MQLIGDDVSQVVAKAEMASSGRWWTLAAVCTGVFMLLLDLTIVNVALPEIERAFRASLSDLQWVISAYALTLAAFLLTAGSLADLYGRRLLFAAGIVLFTAGSLCCGLAANSLMLTLSRAGQGVGGAVMFATALALLAQAFQGRERSTALGLFGAVTGVAIAVGPVLGGVITGGLSWRWIFFVNVPIGVIALLITLLRVNESRNPEATRPDWAGCATFSAALGGLVYGLIDSQRDGWGSPEVIVCLGASVTLLGAGFILVGAGLFLMRGVTPGSGWTHLLAGMIVAGPGHRPGVNATGVDRGPRARARSSDLVRRRDPRRHECACGTARPGGEHCPVRLRRGAGHDPARRGGRRIHRRRMVRAHPRTRLRHRADSHH